jgi:hypothetical protein
MRRMVDKLLKQYGTQIVLYHNGEQIALKGFLQTGGSLSQRSAKRKMSPLGEIPGNQYLYIGPADSPAQAGDILLQNGRKYELRQLETILYCSEPIYHWGLCVEAGGADTWAH